MNKLIAAALVTTVSALPALAFEPVGGEVGLSYGAFTDDNDFAKTNLNGSVEMGINRDLSVQGDLGLNNFNMIDETGSNIALHGIYNANDYTSLGAFVGREEIANEDWTYYGLELGQKFGQFGYEAALTAGSEDGVDMTNIGLRGRYAVMPELGVGARLDFLTADIDGLGDLDATRIGLNTDYSFGNGLIVSGEFGHTDVDYLGGDNYFKLGAKFVFGTRNGTTFDQRGLQDLIPGL